MAIALYDVTVPQFLQVVRALRGVLDKSLDHAKAQGRDPDELVEARLAEDMFPLYLQARLIAHHSAGALRNVSEGAFSLPSRERASYAGLQQILAETETELSGLAREAVDALEGREVVLDMGAGSRTVFTAEAFLTSFSLPNFYFHAVTAYDILRAQGAPIGKRDYLTGLRTKL
jgi:hypothetical protein